jgi:hypothetical protein
MTFAAVDRLFHHAAIFEINVESYRRRAAFGRKQKGAGRRRNHATITHAERQSGGNLALLSDNQKDHDRCLYGCSVPS